jgi:hypothetical protein
MMNGPILGHDEETRLFQELAAQYDAPAYIRRARRVEGAFEQVLIRCQNQHKEWLFMVRLRLGVLYALAGDLDHLDPLLPEDSRSRLSALHAELQPRLRSPLEPTSSVRILSGALEELCESMVRFNRRWRAFLPTVDLTAVNQLRADYNRYYLLEKECALRSARLARVGYQPLTPLTIADLEANLPLLSLPRTREAQRGTS